MNKLKLRKLKQKGFKWYLLSILGWISFFNLLTYITDNKSTFDIYDWLTSIILSIAIVILTFICVTKEEKITSQYYKILLGDEE